MDKFRPGLVILALKLAPKIFPVINKIASDVLWPVVKSLLGVKSAGLVASLGLYTYLFTWQMAVALVVFIGIHEYGHLWAMKQCGIKNKGMFFLPGFGAVALAEERFKSARNEAYIAIMGPIFGLVFFVFPMMGIYWYTEDAMWAALGAIMAFINLVNLFPINPLDGGRILKAVAYSKRQVASLCIIVVVSLVTAGLGMAAGFFLLIYMAVLGLWEIADEFGIKDRVSNFLMMLVRAGFVIASVILVHYLLKEWEKSEWFLVLLIGHLLFALMALFIYDVKTNTTEEGRSIFAYPLVMFGELNKGVKQVFSLRAADIRPIDNYDRMGGGGKVWYAFSFLFICAVHVMTIIVLGHVPGAELAREMMK